MNAKFSNREVSTFQRRLSLPPLVLSRDPLSSGINVRRVHINMVPASEVRTITPNPQPSMEVYRDRFVDFSTPTTDDDFWRALHEL